MIISDEQVKKIANSIVFDVLHYIQEHQEEYEKFLAEETSNNEQCSNSQNKVIKKWEENKLCLNLI